MSTWKQKVFSQKQEKKNRTKILVVMVKKIEVKKNRVKKTRSQKL